MTETSRWDLSDIEVAATSEASARNVLRSMTLEIKEKEANRIAFMKVAQRLGLSLRDIAEVVDLSPQTVSKLCKDPIPT